MAARRPASDPLAETPFWRTRQFVFGMIVLAVIATAGLTVWLVKLNKQQQREWRLGEDPRLSKTKQDLIARIAAAKPGQARAPAALWLGRIKEYTETQRTTGSPSFPVLRLEGANLLAGVRSRKDNDGGDTPVISGRDYSFGGPAPRVGEIWMIAVWRDADERNFIHTALRTSLK